MSNVSSGDNGGGIGAGGPGGFGGSSRKYGSRVQSSNDVHIKKEKKKKENQFNIELTRYEQLLTSIRYELGVLREVYDRTASDMRAESGQSISDTNADAPTRTHIDRLTNNNSDLEELHKIFSELNMKLQDLL